jgi:hypothetical protein
MILTGGEKYFGLMQFVEIGNLVSHIRVDTGKIGTTVEQSFEAAFSEVAFKLNWKF